jgi:hypothetical protein
MRNGTKVWIPKEDMVIFATYECLGRNLGIGVWNGESFDYMRNKFGATFPDKEYHWDDGPPHGTCKPIRRLEV